VRIIYLTIVFAALLLAQRAQAEVLSTSPGGFSLAHEVVIEATREDVWQAAVSDVGRWWSNEHTISGDAANMSIDAVPQGCFCEAIGEHAGVVHLTVTFVNPTVILRLTGGLGPLGLMGVDGNMTWEFFDDEGTRVRFKYVVGGYRPGGLDEIAAAVDGVIGQALQRLKSYSETGQPERRDD
jgi:uncharacterized protein YndB with AHSA1/START domain